MSTDPIDTLSGSTSVEAAYTMSAAYLDLEVPGDARRRLQELLPPDEFAQLAAELDRIAKDGTAAEELCRTALAVAPLADLEDEAQRSIQSAGNKATLAGGELLVGAVFAVALFLVTAKIDISYDTREAKTRSSSSKHKSLKLSVKPGGKIGPLILALRKAFGFG